MTVRFQVLIKKAPGNGRTMSGIMHSLESEGWRSHRYINKDGVIMDSGKSHHIFKDKASFVKYLRSDVGLTDSELGSIDLIEV